VSTEIKVVETIRGKELAEVLERLSKSDVGVKFKLMLDTNGAITELTVTTRDEKEELRLVVRNYNVVAEHTKTAESVRFEFRFKEEHGAFARLKGLGLKTSIQAATLQNVRDEAQKILANIGMEYEALTSAGNAYRQEIHETANGIAVTKEREAIESDKDIIATINDTEMPF
jgi:hypothetical protein